jgi:hypothetical protein
MKFHSNIFDTVEDNILFKLLSGPREVDLEMRSFDENDNMVALSRSFPSTNARVMSCKELEIYLVTMLGVKCTSESSNRSH